tara:strand:- start:510 stop:644 length:135 start_codon:yes stop_codon:yes gene_type:complete
MSRIDAGFDVSKIPLNSDTHKVLIIEANSLELIGSINQKASGNS